MASASPPGSPTLSDDETASVLSGSGTGTGTTGTRLGSLASAQLSTFNLSSLGLPAQQVASASTSTLQGGFNAISTVLNNPKKKQHPIDPHSSRFAPLPAHKEAEIARVNRETVQGYIDDVGSEWKRYVRNRDLGKRGKARMGGSEGDEDSNAPTDNPIAQAAASALAGKTLPPLNAVPQIFFDEEFNLGNPYTFDVVTEKYGSQGGEGNTPHTGHSPDHLEKLSHYSDLVEQHLLHEISTRSSSFFSALGALQDLSQSSASCLSLIRSLRSDLVSISDSQVKAGLHIVRKQDERWTLLEEMRGVELIQHWCEGKRMAELMVGQGEYDEALVVIERLKEQARGGDSDDDDEDDEDSAHTVHLSRIPAILALVPQLDDLQANISQALESELASVLHAELEQRQDLTEDTASWALAPRVEPLLNGLVRTQGLERTLTTAYRPLVLASVRSALRSSLPRSEDDSALTALFDLLDDDLAATGQGESKSGEAGMVAARRLREMSTGEFREKVLDKACAGLEGVLTAIAHQKRHLLRALDTMARQEGVEEGGDEDEYLMPSRVPFSLAQSLTSQLHSSIEVAHILLARLISLRASSHIELPLREFLSIFHPLMAFAERTEKISVSTRAPSTRRLIPLRSTLLNQSKEWLRYFHRVRLEKAARYVEEETWSQVEVKRSDVEVVKRLVACATSDPQEWRVGGGDDEGSASAQDSTSDSTTQSTLPVPTNDESNASPSRSYYVVPATVHVVHLTQEYMTTLVNFSQMAAVTDVMSRAVEFLKQFNSRTCQVVLGAGAMRSAGLKNITAKHLALASQSLSLFIHLIPHLRECVRRHLPDERQAVMLIEFDKLKRDFQEHQNEIHSKLVAIMGDRLSVHCKGLAAIDWNASNDSTSPSKPTTDLVKETMTLQKVLTRYLSSSTVDSVLNQVLDTILKRVGVEFARVEVTSESCKPNMNRDVTYLDSKLGGLKTLSEGIVWDSEALRGVVNAKGLAVESRSSTSNEEQPPAPQPSTPQLNSSPRSSTDLTSTPTQGPAAYKSRMFPFGRRAGQQSPSGSGSATPTGNATPQQQSSYFSSYVSRGVRANGPPATPTKGAGGGAGRVLGGEEHREEQQDEGERESEHALPPHPSSDDVVAVAQEDVNGQVEVKEELASASAGGVDASTTTPGEVEAAPAKEEIAEPEPEPRPEPQAAAEPPTPDAETTTPPTTVDGSASPSLSTSTAAQPSVPTPTTAQPPPSTPKPARMTLQQRLAEAARKRSQQARAQKLQEGGGGGGDSAGGGTDSVDSAISSAGTSSTDTPPPTPAKDRAVGVGSVREGSDGGGGGEMTLAQAATPAEVEDASPAAAASGSQIVSQANEQSESRAHDEAEEATPSTEDSIPAAQSNAESTPNTLADDDATAAAAPAFDTPSVTENMPTPAPPAVEVEDTPQDSAEDDKGATSIEVTAAPAIAATLAPAEEQEAATNAPAAPAPAVKSASPALDTEPEAKTDAPPQVDDEPTATATSEIKASDGRVDADTAVGTTDTTDTPAPTTAPSSDVEDEQGDAGGEETDLTQTADSAPSTSGGAGGGGKKKKRNKKKGGGKKK